VARLAEHLADVRAGMTQHFDQFVERRGEDECWPYIGGHDSDGYGVYRIPGGKQVRAHRHAFALTNDGDQPPCVCHTCDNPCCCNPGHLFAGDAKANYEDMVRKGRRAPLRNAVKLTERDAREIRAKYEAKTGTYKQIGAEYGVDGMMVSLIGRRKSWAWVDEAEVAPE
jgi:hypothetical protein